MSVWKSTTTDTNKLRVKHKFARSDMALMGVVVLLCVNLFGCPWGMLIDISGHEEYDSLRIYASAPKYTDTDIAIHC